MSPTPAPILVVKEKKQVLQPIDPFLDFLDILSTRLSQGSAPSPELQQVSALVRRIQTDVRTLRSIYWPMSVGVEAELWAEAVKQAVETPSAQTPA